MDHLFFKENPMACRRQVFSRAMLATVLTLLTVLQPIPFGTVSTAAATEIAPALPSSDNLGYGAYLRQHEQEARPVRSVKVNGASAITSTEEVPGVTFERPTLHDGREGVLLWYGGAGTATFEVDVPEAGLYRIGIEYEGLAGGNGEIEFAITVDGQMPFRQAQSILLPRRFHSVSTDRVLDPTGNELRAKQVETVHFEELDAADTEGFFEDPYLFHFEQGRHTLALSLRKESVALAGIRIHSATQAPDYATYTSAQDGDWTVYDGPPLLVQGENASETTSPILYPMYDRSSPATQPNDPSRIRYNTIGQWNWRYQGQRISWRFEVPADGLYRVDVKARQNFLRGLFVTRRLLVDGAVPFVEAERVRFPYDFNWYRKTLSDEVSGNPLLLRLSKGPHEISLEATTGEMAQTLDTLDNSLLQLNTMMRKIRMVTGSLPDPIRDYQLEAEIAELSSVFRSNAAVLVQEARRLESISGQAGSEASFLDEFARQLDDFVKDPMTIAGRLDRYAANLASLGDWILRMKEVPLEIDWIALSGIEGKDLPVAKHTFFQKLVFDFQAFTASFVQKYNAIGTSGTKGKSLEVWMVGVGRDQAQLLRDLIEERYTPVSGVPVNLSLVGGSETLIQAVLAGKGPDVAVCIPKETPVNLAMRGALVEMSGLPGFDKVKDRFLPSALIPYDYEGGIYALPQTQSFNMVFYRKDIFQELGIEVPDTWDDFYRILPVILRNNMQVGIPESQTVFETLLFQRGVSFYAPERNRTGFDSQEALDAFRQWTDFYSVYGLPFEFDFFNRFRTGEMPMGIAPYTFYNQISAAAPEIRNLWAMAPVPGIADEQGRVNRAESAFGSGGIILSDCDDTNVAFGFLDWWTTADTQSAYGRALEALMGPAARYDTANLEAFGTLRWTTEERTLLETQWEQVSDVLQIPGNYFASRNLTNAFRSVVYRQTNPRETLNRYNGFINEEILRKRKEFGLK
jgi:ABC-type glycerol-3-phosphate transport system substrate-binding protein